MSTYHSFSNYVIKTPGGEMAVMGKPGVWSWDRLNAGTSAIMDVAEVAPSDRVLDLGCGTGVLGAYACRQAVKGRVELVDCNVAAVACARRTLVVNDGSNGVVRLADGVAGLAPASFDLVLCHLPRGRAVQEALINGAAWVLRPGGRFILAAGKRAGVKGAIEYARKLFGRCSVVRQKKGYHVALALRLDVLESPRPEERYDTFLVSLDGVETKLVSKPGVFAWNHLDDGTAALVEAMAVEAGDRVLDLGCGSGLAGLAAARRAPEGEVVLLDADVRAVESARRTLEANKISNAEALASDSCAAVFDRSFDVVITNPPFHQGVGVDYEVACQFVHDASRVLRPGGRFFLVANRFLNYDKPIARVFGNATRVWDDRRYHVLTAVARRSGSA